MDRKNKLKKGINSLEKQIAKHEKKIAEYHGPKDTLIGYWQYEIQCMKREKHRKLEVKLMSPEE